MIPSGKKLISIVIPIFNEEQSLVILHNQIRKIFKKRLAKLNYEIIFINDGSTDNSLTVLKKLKQNDHHIKLITFGYNLGKAASLNQGFKKAQGEIVITLDGDLQDGPENIPGMLVKFNEGFDLVVGWRKKRMDSISKKWPSSLFNFGVRFFSGIPLHDFNSGLKVMASEVAKDIYLHGELHRFIPVLAYQKGFKITEVKVIHHPRKYGKSKYGTERFIRGFLDFFKVLFFAKKIVSPYRGFSGR
jgi:glycosyltransferase involved in cell wall biosynthesis